MLSRVTFTVSPLGVDAVEVGAGAVVEYDRVAVLPAALGLPRI